MAPRACRVAGRLSEAGEACVIGCGDKGDRETLVKGDIIVRAIRAIERVVAIVIFLVVMFVSAANYCRRDKIALD